MARIKPSTGTLPATRIPQHTLLPFRTVTSPPAPLKNSLCRDLGQERSAGAAFGTSRPKPLRSGFHTATSQVICLAKLSGLQQKQKPFSENAVIIKSSPPPFQLARLQDMPTLSLPSAFDLTLVRTSLACLIASWLSFAIATADDETLKFNQDIRPILSENCFHCHGPDEDARAAELQLDHYEGATEWAIVPGNADESEVISRIHSDDPDLVMPPPESERALTDQQKKQLKQWVNEGARYEKHWSFNPINPVTVPRLTPDDTTDWQPENAIDGFVMQRLQRAGFSMAPRADSATLVRRITFDLTGLPPTPEQVQRFLADKRPDAVERLIDRLLSHPAFGQRMAADWLDVARYSDTYGYQVDRDRFVWPYRDWVVRAFNKNLPYDQFLTQQLAGDLLPDAQREQILATTFNRLHPQKVEGGSVPEEFRVEYVSDRAQTVGTAFLGLTFECCRCHTHKYDPITQTEYYQLASFFANIDEAGLYSYFTSSVPTPTMTLPNATQETQLQERRQAVRAAEAASQGLLDEQPDFADLESDLITKIVDAAQQPLGDADLKTAKPALQWARPIETTPFEGGLGANKSVAGVVGKAVQLTGDDAVNLKTGNFRREQPFSISLWIKTPDAKERAVILHRSRAWTDAASRGYQLLMEDGKLSWSLIHFWPGNALRIKTTEPIPVNQWLHVVVSNDGSSRAAGLSLWINGSRAETTVVRDHLTKNITGGGGNQIALGQRFRDRGFTGGCIDEVAVFDQQLTALEIDRLARQHSNEHWTATPPASWNAAQQQLVAQHAHHRCQAEVTAQRAELATRRRSLFQLQDGLQEIMVMREMPGVRTTHRLDRGAYDSPAEAVTPGTPKSVMAFDQQPDRLGLARWMLDPKNPLTSRVAANRLWQMCFGEGLVRTPEDFGSQGKPPTHPELLDWLAADLMQHDWDIKRCVKQIMMSATYQQSSAHPDSKVAQSDPENLLLAKYPAHRLPAEMLRDQVLAVSGLLVSDFEGAPVKPYELEASFKPSKADQGQGLYRRSLYTYWKRTGPAPAMMTLDASKRDVCCVKRERTSSPLQAFVMMNGPQYVEASRGLAIQLLARTNDTDQVLRDAFRTLIGRAPSDDEQAIIDRLYQQQQAYFAEHSDRATAYLQVGRLRSNLDLPAAQIAATSVVVGVLMNHDECMIQR